MRNAQGGVLKLLCLVLEVRMNIREYLMIKYQTDKPNSMLSCERKAFGIKMQSGWLQLYGDKVICAETEARLRIALSKRHCESAKIGLAVLNGEYAPQLAAIRSNMARQIRNAKSKKWNNDLTDRVYIDCPFVDKNEAKMLGARWDSEERLWYVPAGVDLLPFQKWMPIKAELVPMQKPDGSVIYRH